MGKMVADVKAAIDVVLDIPNVEVDQIILSGYSLGATVALFAAALDDRITDAVILDPFSPFRTNNKNIEGIAHFYHDTGLIPRLGLFKDNPMEIPVDLQEIIIASKAHTSLLINEKSRHIEAELVKKHLQNAGKHKKIQWHFQPQISLFNQPERKKLIEMLQNGHE